LTRAARDLSVAARELSSAAKTGGSGLGIAAAWREETAAAVASGMLTALRRAQSDPIIAPTGRETPGPSGGGYGRMGAMITGRGEKASTYGAIGGMLGYAVGGPIGGLVGGMLGGLFGGKKKKSKAELQRQWLNTPEGFEIQSYLYNLSRVGSSTSFRRGWNPVRVERVNINITGSGAEAGLEAGRAFATFLGRQVALNSAVAQAPDMI